MARSAPEGAAQGALISVAAGASQLPLLRSAKELGLALIAIDREPNAPGFRECDLCVVASTHDSAAASGALATALRTRPDLVPVAVATKSSGAPVATAADLARSLNLTGLEPARARTLVSKPGQLKFAAFAGLRVPRHCAPPTLEEFQNSGMELPLVLKPAETAVGKRAIALVTHAEDLPEHFHAAQAASLDGRCEIESYLPGEDLVIAALFRDSRLLTTTLLDEDTRFMPGGDVRGFGLSLPSKFAGQAAAHSAQKSVESFITQLELGTGFGLWTFRVTETGPPAMLELHLDLAGDLVTDSLLPRALGQSVISLALENLLGREVRFAEPKRAVAVRFLFEADRPKVEGLGASHGELMLYQETAAGERIGHVLLDCLDRQELEGSILGLDHALGRNG